MLYSKRDILNNLIISNSVAWLVNFIYYPINLDGNPIIGKPAHFNYCIKTGILESIDENNYIYFNTKPLIMGPNSTNRKYELSFIVPEGTLFIFESDVDDVRSDFCIYNSIFKVTQCILTFAQVSQRAGYHHIAKFRGKIKPLIEGSFRLNFKADSVNISLSKTSKVLVSTEEIFDVLNEGLQTLIKAAVDKGYEKVVEGLSLKNGKMKIIYHENEDKLIKHTVSREFVYNEPLKISDVLYRIGENQ